MTRLTRRGFVGGLAASVVLSVLSGCQRGNREEDEMTGPTDLTSGDLPPPAESGVPIEVALRGRRSVREFADEPLTRTEIGQLLWAAQGVTADWGGRTAPSAGALYPLELYAVAPSGTGRYVPDGHRIEPVDDRDLRVSLMAAALGQEAIGRAPLVVAIVAVPERTATTYGERAGRYVDLEAGHAAQNLLLQAAAIDLAAVPIGAFDDDEVGEILRLPRGWDPRYLLPVGRPRS